MPTILWDRLEQLQQMSAAVTEPEYFNPFLDHAARAPERGGLRQVGRGLEQNKQCLALIHISKG
jgi:hypothetical protein